MSFERYTDYVFQAFYSHSRQTEIIKRKQEILNGVATFHNYSPESVLYIGFNPAILIETAKKIYVTEISQQAHDFLVEKKINFEYIPKSKLIAYQKKINVVVALDEYFTFVHSDNEQKLLVEEICNLTTDYIITTCRDYKNQDFKDREFSTPALIRGQTENQIYLEFHDHDLHDRNSWKTSIYEIKNSELNIGGPYARRAMFFKQLAKFSSDAGAVGFTVHKNLMYKSLIKKNYEHVISIRFDNGS